MSLLEGIILYHGSYTAVERVDLSECSIGKDFGKGFYLSSDETQARSFIKTSVLKAKYAGKSPLDERIGYVSRFRITKTVSSLNTCRFANADAGWLRFIAANRSKSAAAVLADRIPSALTNADLIIGKIANDNTNAVIAAFIGGLYGDITSETAVQTAISLLLPDRLKDQYCFRTERAIGCLEYAGAHKYEY